MARFRRPGGDPQITLDPKMEGGQRRQAVEHDQRQQRGRPAGQTAATVRGLDLAPEIEPGRAARSAASAACLNANAIAVHHQSDRRVGAPPR